MGLLSPLQGPFPLGAQFDQVYFELGEGRDDVPRHKAWKFASADPV